MGNFRDRHLPSSAPNNQGLGHSPLSIGGEIDPISLALHLKMRTRFSFLDFFEWRVQLDHVIGGVQNGLTCPLGGWEGEELCGRTWTSTAAWKIHKETAQENGGQGERKAYDSVKPR